MIVPKDARALLHYRRCARPRHLRVLQRERAGDADRADDCAVEDDGEAALERRDVLDGKQAQPGAAGGDDVVERLARTLELQRRVGLALGDAD